MTAELYDTPSMLALLEKLVLAESPSHEKSAVDDVGKIILDECRRIGEAPTIHECQAAGNIVEATFQPVNESRPGSILLLAHMDTVFPLGTISNMPYYEQGEKIFGPGVSDMKGGIVVILSALERLIETGSLKRPVTALFTPDEEIGSSASRQIIEEKAGQSCLVLVFEPGLLDGAVKTWRKGVGEYSITVQGKAAHAGADHAQGRNAIEEISKQVLAIQQMTDYTKGTTLNVGVIHGGIASNVVPSEASIEVDLRVLQPGEAERIHNALMALKPQIDGTTIKVNGCLNRPPMPFDDLMQRTFEKCKGIAAGAGFELIAGGTGGASDANFVAPLGIPVLDGLGPIGAGYHSEREYILKDSLESRVRLVSAILQEWQA